MKTKITSYIITVIFALSLIPIYAQEPETAPMVYLEQTNVRSEDKTFDVSVKTVDTIKSSEIFTYLLEMSFNAEKLEAVDIIGNSSVIENSVKGAVGYKKIDNINGTISFMYCLNDKSFEESSDRLLATVKFKVLDVGKAKVSIDKTNSKFLKKDSYDGESNKINVTYSEGNYKSELDLSVGSVDKPVFDMSVTTFTSTLTIRFKEPADKDVKIYYTASSNVDEPNLLYDFSDPFRISNTATVRAYAEKNGVRSGISDRRFTRVTPTLAGGGGTTSGGTSVIAPIPSTAASANEVEKYSDIENHWAKQYFDKLITKGIINGYEDGTIRPDNQVTRAEAAKIIISALGLAPSGNTNLTFADSGDIDDWAKEYVQIAVEKGIITGYEDNTFKPRQSVSRKEIVVLAIRAFSLSHEDAGSLTFADANTIPDWASHSVAVALKFGILTGYEDNTFKPDNFVTRGETSKIILSCLEL